MRAEKDAMVFAERRKEAAAASSELIRTPIAPMMYAEMTVCGAGRGAQGCERVQERFQGL